MKTLKSIGRSPCGLMVLLLMLGALLNAIDQAHLPSAEYVVEALGTAPTKSSHYELLRVGRFVEALFKRRALTLIGLFPLCAASQMDLRAAGTAMKKGNRFKARREV